jgi:F0F1-type ATP synthase assembly protein I
LVGAGIGGGYWLDETFKTGLLFMLVGLGLGMAAAGAVLYFGIREFL